MTTRRLAATILSVALLAVIPATTVKAQPSRGDIQKELDRLGNEISVVNEEYNLARIQLSKVEQEIKDLKVRQERAGTDIAALRGQASERAAAVYKTGMPDVLLVLFDSTSLSEFGRRMGFVSRVGDWQTGMIDSLEIARARSDHLNQDLQAEVTKRRRVAESIAAKKATLQKRVAEQQQLLARAEAQATRARRPARPVPQPVAVPVDLPVSGSARVAVETAYAQIGKPYRYGASGPDSFDCSGLTMYSWGKAGVSLPHSSRAQYSATKRVDRGSLQPGDLVFFGRPIHHVGIYVGNGNMVHSPESGERVRVWSMNRSDYAGAGRPGV
jgi:cell wall-associated NlpC family hydrolase